MNLKNSIFAISFCENANEFHNTVGKNDRAKVKFGIKLVFFFRFEIVQTSNEI
jgi:hypothetical protein